MQSAIFNEGSVAPVQVQAVARRDFLRKGYFLFRKTESADQYFAITTCSEVREKGGGAYGAWNDFTPGGYQFFVSLLRPKSEGNPESL
jgi:hypothetical protein